MACAVFFAAIALLGAAMFGIISIADAIKFIFKDGGPHYED